MSDALAMALARLREELENVGASGEFALQVSNRDATVLKALPRNLTAYYEPRLSDTHYADGRVEPPVLQYRFAGVPILVN